MYLDRIVDELLVSLIEIFRAFAHFLATSSR